MIAITYITGLSCTHCTIQQSSIYYMNCNRRYKFKVGEVCFVPFFNQTMDRQFVSISSIVSLRTILKHASSIHSFYKDIDSVTNKFELIDFQSIFPFPSFLSFSFYINVILINNKLYGYWLSQPDICSDFKNSEPYFKFYLIWILK